jgi:hypothetical protein
MFINDKMVRTTIKKLKGGDWGIFRGSRMIDTESRKNRAQEGAKFYRAYYKVPAKKRREWVLKARR